MFVETRLEHPSPLQTLPPPLYLSHTHTVSVDVGLEWLEGGITGSGGSSWRQCVWERERKEGLQGAAAPLCSDLDMLHSAKLLTCFLRAHITQVRTQPPHTPALRLY